jgi:hypothetical protein
MVTAPSVSRASAPELGDWESHTEIGPSPVLDLPEPEANEGDRPSTVGLLNANDTLAARVAEKNAELAKIRVAHDAEIAKMRAELDAERRKQAPIPSLVPPAQVEQYERKLEKKSHKPINDGALKALLLKLGAALTGLVVVLTTSAQLLNQYVEWKLKNVEAKQSAQAETLKPLPAAAASADKSADACRDWAKATDDYNRQVFAKLGVIIPQQPNAMPVTEIKTRAPVRKGNSVTGAPVLEIITAPPKLP